MSVLDRSWKYRSADETAKPGYLKRRFEEIRKEQRERAKEQAAKVQPIGRVKR